jgi:hypothetical protein
LLSVNVNNDLRGFADLSLGFFSVEHICGRGEEKAFSFFRVSKLSWLVWLIVIFIASLFTELTLASVGELGVFAFESF